MKKNKKVNEMLDVYDRISFELKNYEHSTDNETTDEEWKDSFYGLLCLVHNYLSTELEERGIVI